MESHLCYLRLLVSSITYFLLLNQLLAHSLFHVHHHHPGIPINVTKNLHFPSFISSSSRSTIHEIKLLGRASISSDKGFIQIPDPSPGVNHAYKAGRAIYSSPIRIFDPLTSTPASFQTTFSFQFTNINNSFPGNGLAFVIVSDEFTVGRPGPWLGILNDACEHYKVFAVEFDNRHDPKFGDPNDDHVGINLGSVVSFKTADASKTNNSLHEYHLIHRAWIMYDGRRKWIDIYLGADGNPVPSLPILSTSLNLSPFLEEYMFVGFSASTGDSPQIHNIFSWEFSSTSQAILKVPSRHVCHRNIAHQVSKYSTTNRTSTPSSFMIFMCVMGLCTVAVLNLYYNSKRRKTESPVAFGFPDKKQRPVPPSKPRRFETLVLYRATKRFSKMEVLARDSRGVLYRGMLPNGSYVAVKRFSTESLTLSRLDWSRVLKRISSITRVCHPSLASIRGWCCDNRERIIVYDYFQNGSLHGWLFGLGSLTWTRRFELIKDIAEALSFLHCKELTHGNLKTTSIFIDSNYKAVLGDYGFIFFQGDVMDSVPRKELDVFEFGMLVLEIISGKKTIETEEQEMGVLDLAWDMHERGEKVKVIDERMGSNVNIEQAIRVLEIGLACTLNENENGRPSMEQVLLQLNMQNLIPRLPPNRQAHLLSKNSATGQLLIGNTKGSH